MTLQRPNKKERATAREILVEARKMLARQRGWVKGAMTGYGLVKPIEIDATGVIDSNAHCQLGALDVAAAAFRQKEGRFGFAEDIPFEIAKRALTQVLPVTCSKDAPNDIINANDTGSTKKHHVLAWLDQAIEALS